MFNKAEKDFPFPNELSGYICGYQLTKKKGGDLLMYCLSCTVDLCMSHLTPIPYCPGYCQFIVKS